MQKEIEWLLLEKYKGGKTPEFFADCARLEAGVPLAYVIGYVPFLDTIIFLDSQPLIPRPETEFWTKEVIELMKNGDETLKILDMCAGSGCVGVSVLKALPKTTVHFAELDESHHSTILKNITANNIDPLRTEIYGGDLFQNIVSSYDVILANPPYIDPEIDRAEDSVKAHEPHLALYGGMDGLHIISKIMKDALLHLLANGVLVVEHEPEQEEAIQELALKLGYSATTEKDQYNIPRYTVLTRRRERNVAP